MEQDDKKDLHIKIKIKLDTYRFQPCSVALFVVFRIQNVVRPSVVSTN